MANLIQLAGYRMKRPLGRGGMGSVFLAEKVSTSEPVAIKFLRQDCMDDPAYLGRFAREVEALRAIRHPNVVNVYSWFIPEDLESEHRPHVVMEYLEGEGLDKVLARERKLEPLVAVRIMLQVLDGLAAAHGLGVIHRDLGPSNVFLLPRTHGRFQVKLLDFGLARQVQIDEEQSDLTQRGTLMGKPAYVAPEMLNGLILDARSDIFGCGVLLYRMLAGQFPYKETDSHLLWVERMRDAHARTEYPPPSTLVPDLPESLDRVVSKSIRVEAADRYPTAEAMQEDLMLVENLLSADHPSAADYSSSRPGLRVEVGPAEPDSRSAMRPTGLDATPTVGGVPAPVPAARKRGPLLVAAGLGALAAVSLVAFLALRGSGPGPAAPDAAEGTVGAATALPDAVEPEAAAKVAEVDAVAPPEVSVPVVAVPPDAGPDLPPPALDVILVVRGAPRGAVVTAGERVLEGDPPTGVVPRSESPLRILVEARGYQSFSTEVLPVEDREITVELRRLAGGRDGGRAETTTPSIPGVVEEPPF